MRVYSVFLLFAIIGVLSVFVSSQENCKYQYFDPHNHVNGIMPWEAFADLPGYIKGGYDPANIGRTAKENLWNFITNYFIKNNIQPHIYDPVSRLGYGTIATAYLFPNASQLTNRQLDDVLNRVLTATPFTEFDGAYKLRGIVSDSGDNTSYWLGTLYNQSKAQLYSDLCDATINTLSKQEIGISEQSLSFSSWSEEKINWLNCFVSKNTCKTSHRLLLQTLTNFFAIQKNNGNSLDALTNYTSIEATGKCQLIGFASPVNLSRTLDQYYVGLTKNPNPNITDEVFYDTVVGVDTAGPELACFTDFGMNFFKKLAKVIYDASKARRSAGWKGRLLFHTHVGEGGAIYYKKNIPSSLDFNSIFGSLPLSKVVNGISNPQAASNNIAMMIEAVEEFKEKYPDTDKYMLFRFGHVTHATLSQARDMARLDIEADVNMESNLITGALNVKPLDLNNNRQVKKDLADPINNFLLDDLTTYLVPDPTNIRTVGKIYGKTSLKYLLEAGVRIPMILGTDGEGVEHSDMVRGFQIARTLIRYWNRVDPKFRKLGLDIGVFKEFSNDHLDLMEGAKFGQVLENIA